MNKFSNEKALKLDEQYSIHKKIGKGTFGSVYLGKDLKNNNPVAIKMGNINKSSTLIKEAKILTKLRGLKGFPKMLECTQIED